MQTSSKRHNASELVVPDLDLPVLPAIARRPPVLTMDQYFILNDEEGCESGERLTVPANEKCAVPFTV